MALIEQDSKKVRRKVRASTLGAAVASVAAAVITNVTGLDVQEQALIEPATYVVLSVAGALGLGYFVKEDDDDVAPTVDDDLDEDESVLDEEVEYDE